MMTDLPNNSDKNTGDDLRNELHELTDSVIVGRATGLTPQERHSQRVRRGRVGIASLAALAVGSIVLVSTRESPEAGTVIAAADNAVSLAPAPAEPVIFDQRIVDGVVAYGQSIVHTDDGTTYVLSTSPTATWPSEEEMMAMDGDQMNFPGELPQAIYSTTDGENWAITELGDLRLSSLTERNGLLYSLTTSEGENGDVNASYVSSSDGGTTWAGPTLDFGPIEAAGALQAHSAAYTDYQLISTDAVQLAVRNTYWDLDWEWVQSQLDVEPDQYPEFEGDKVVVRDWSACDAFYETQMAEEQRAIGALIASGMTEDEAYKELYGDDGGVAYEQAVAVPMTTMLLPVPTEPTVGAEARQDDIPSATTGPPTEATVGGAADPDSSATTLSPSTTLGPIGETDEPVTTALDGEFATTAPATHSEYEEPAECSNPPILVEKSLAELGIEGFTPDSNQSLSALRSTDGVNWEPVDVPGDWVTGSGSTFMSQSFPNDFGGDDLETKMTMFTSTDGAIWTKTDPQEAFLAYRELKSPLNGAFTSFSVDYAENLLDAGSEDAYDDDYEYTSTVMFGTSPDGLTWSDTAVAVVTEGSTASSWPVVQEVGPLGAVVVLQHYDMSVPEMAHQVGGEGYEESYDDYIDSISYTILYSQDGKAWQEVELESPPAGDISYGFVTAESIVLTFHIVGVGDSGQIETKTLLLTPER